jgi:hypothetical protein
MDNLKGLIPEIYYDMIARVAAGVPFVAILVSPPLGSLEKYSNTASFILLIGIGYIAGHLLTTISVGLNLILWCWPILDRIQRCARLIRPFTRQPTLQVFDLAYQRIDWAAGQDASAGAILKKMEAGAGLSDNLLSGWLTLVLYRTLGGRIGWAIDLGCWNWPILILVSLVLICSVYTRRAAFIIREDRIVHRLDKPASAKGVPT